jgi:ribonuclease HI
MAFTETKLSPKQAKSTWLHTLFSEHACTHHTEIPDDKNVQAHAGVLISIHKDLLVCSTIQKHPPPDSMDGYLCHVTLKQYHTTTLDIIGVYCPPKNDKGHFIRKSVYKYITQHTSTHPNTYTIILGDFNAALLPTDKSSSTLNPSDKLHQTWTQDAKLTPIHEATPRHRTYYKGECGDPISRPDDILIHSPHPISHQTQINATFHPGEGTDHALLTTQIPYTDLGLYPPPPNLPDESPSPKTILITPFNKQDAQKLQQAISDKYNHIIKELLQATETILSTDVQPHTQMLTQTSHRQQCALTHLTHPLNPSNHIPAREMVDEIGTRFTTLMTDIVMLAKDICRTKRTNPKHHTWLPTRTFQKYKRLTQAKQALQAQKKDRLPTPLQSLSLATITSECPSTEHSASPQHITKYIKSELLKINSSAAKQRSQHSTAKINKILHNKPKLGNKIALGKLTRTTKHDLKVIKTTEGTMIFQQEPIKAHIHDYFTNKAKALDQPEPTTANNTYLPADRELDWQYPFEETTTNKPDDPFQLMTNATLSIDDGDTEPLWLHDCMADHTTFQECINHLSNGKAPGPDGVPNEILKALPPQAKKALHNFIQIMWATHLTPSTWKHSNTVLLYKNKGNPLELKYYRRIGLENTLYKLWTKMVTQAITHFAETNQILSPSQGGFRSKRSCHRQLETMLTLIEDANLSKRDLFIVMADFSEAFDTPNHCLLLRTMYDLGFPTDAIEVVKDLYTQSHTSITTPYGPTTPITLERGTIQGDSLSPLLFIIYLEPLLRWLQQGDRGYKPSCIPTDTSTYTSTDTYSNCTFADDLNMTSGTISDHRIQFNKFTTYSKWSGLQPNASKTMGTCILHKMEPQDPTSHKRAQNLYATFTIDGVPIQVHPPKEPFKLLGVWLTLTLNWKKQLEETLTTTRQKIQSLLSSKAAPHYKRWIIKTNIRPALRYAFSLMPYTAHDINRLDSIITTAYKKIFGLPTSTSTALVMEDINKGGLGCTSLAVDYHQTAVQSITRAMNDTTRFGKLTYHHLDTQLNQLATKAMRHTQWLPQFSFRIRQLLAAKQSHIGLIMNNPSGPIRRPLLPTSPLFQLATNTHFTYDPLSQAHNSCQLIWRLGINHVTELISPTENSTLNTTSLKRIYRSKAQPKYLRALNIITTILNHPKGSSLKLHGIGTDPLPPELRTIHPDHLPWLATYRNQHPNAPTYNQPTITFMLNNPGKFSNQSKKRPPPQPDLPIPPQQKSKPSSREVYHTPQTPDSDIPWEQQPTSQQTRWEKIRMFHCGNLKPTSQAIATAYEEHSTREDPIADIEASRTVQGKIHFLTRWQPIIMQQWEIDLLTHPTNHYSTTSVTPVTPTEPQPYHTCEYCETTQTEDIPPLILCPGCHRAYHTLCTQKLIHSTAITRTTRSTRQLPTPTPILQEGDHCANCQIHKDPMYIRDTQTWDVQLAPSWEPEEIIYNDKNSHLIHKADALKSRYTQPPTDKSPPASPCYKHPSKRQGYDPRDLMYDITTGSPDRHKLIIHWDPINPDLDIIPTGSYCLKHSPETTQREINVHDPKGKYISTLSYDRAIYLYHTYQTVTTQHKKHLHSLNITPTTFAQDLADMLIRYTKGTTPTAHHPAHILPEHQRQTYLLPTLFKIHFPTITDRLASPLNVDTTYEKYWSAHPNDTLFGAHYDAYATQWTGCSLVHPDHTPAAQCKAISWALRSAKATDEPCFFILILYPTRTPDYKTNKHSPIYQHWLAHYPNNCQLITSRWAAECVEPTSHIQPGQYFTRGEPNRQTIKGKTHYLVIGNDPGFDKYSLNELYDLIDPTPSHRQPSPSTTPTHSGPLVFHTHKRLKHLPQDTTLPILLPPTPCTIPLMDALPANHPQAHDPEQFIYTDGSVLDLEEGTKGVGAGIVIPGNNNTCTRPTNHSSTPINTALNAMYGIRIPPTPDDTINRAELAAIYAALSVKATHIATDSLTSMHQINKMLLRPQDMQENRHYHLLDSIRSLIINRDEPTHIYKVPAHTGIMGNEGADYVAKQVAKGILEYKYYLDLILPSSNTRNTQYWPHHLPTTHPMTPQPISSPHQPLQTHIHPYQRLGQANQESIYYQLWHQATPLLHPKYSHHFLDHNIVPFQAKRTTLQYRFGQLPNNKLLYRYGISKTDICPLCHQHQDGGHHIASGCPTFLHKYPMYTKRHHQAGRLILSAIAKGQQAGDIQAALPSKPINRPIKHPKPKLQPKQMSLKRTSGNKPTKSTITPKYNYHLYHDVGSAENLDKDNIQILNAKKDIPVPTGTNHADTHSRPDIIIATPDPSQKALTYTHITIVEIKYARDTSIDTQLERALHQHSQLQNYYLNKYPGCQVRIQPIILGVSGAIYTTHTASALESLGIRDKTLTQLLRQLHTHAITSLHEIVTLRRQLERRQSRRTNRHTATHGKLDPG